eukprot:5006996-Pyramimonas_sp.AAC.1
MRGNVFIAAASQRACGRAQAAVFLRNGGGVNAGPASIDNARGTGIVSARAALVESGQPNDTDAPRAHSARTLRTSRLLSTRK